MTKRARTGWRKQAVSLPLTARCTPAARGGMSWIPGARVHQGLMQEKDAGPSAGWGAAIGSPAPPPHILTVSQRGRRFGLNCGGSASQGPRRRRSPMISLPFAQNSPMHPLSDQQESGCRGGLGSLPCVVWPCRAATLRASRCRPPDFPKHPRPAAHCHGTAPIGAETTVRNMLLSRSKSPFPGQQSPWATRWEASRALCIKSKR